jgi:hypothetical protein
MTGYQMFTVWLIASLPLSLLIGGFIGFAAEMKPVGPAATKDADARKAA